jgi:ABC-2 type transport system ATP-binding protein
LTSETQINYTLLHLSAFKIMIRVQSLSRTFGNIQALHDLSFEVSEGEVLGFLGPNGAGKTTTMRILTGSLGATSGEVSVAGHDIRTESQAARAALGYLPEAPPLYLNMTVGDYLDHAARLRRVESSDRAAAIAQVLRRTGLEAVADRLIDHLSKGFRQRVGIAQALVHSPKLLILDEPTSGLDPAQMAEIRELIEELRGRHTIVLSTHILSEVQQSCDRVMILAAGRKVAEGTEGELRSVLGGGSRVRLTLARPSAEVVTLLSDITGVESVTPLPSGRYEIDTGELDLREDINATVQPFGLLESRSREDLEDLYLKAVSE